MPFEKTMATIGSNEIISTEKTRCYFFQNMYLIGIHAGIQSSHSITKMCMKYRDNRKKDSMLFTKWAMEDITKVVLNGGGHEDLEEVEELLENDDNPYPWSSFRESRAALNESMTNIGIVLPETIYLPSRLFSRTILDKNKSDEVEEVVSYKEFLQVVQLRNGGVRIKYINKKNEIKIEGNYTPFEMELMRKIGSSNLMN